MKRFPLSNISVLAATALAGTAFLLVSGCHHSSSGSTSNGTVTAPLAKLTPISDCTIDVDHDVEIGGPTAKPNCDTVEMDPSTSAIKAYDEIEINNGGRLIIEGKSISVTGSNSNTREPTVSTICIGNGGTLEIETNNEDAPITSNNKVTLTFTDKDKAIDHTDICKGFTKGIDVETGGSLIMNGAKGVPAYGGISWTTLAAPAGSRVAGAKAASTGLKTLHLTADVTKGKGPQGENEGWQSGDWIVVATTDYTPFHSEFVQIATVTSNAPNPGSTVTLMQPLKYYHFGSLAPSPAAATCPDPFDANNTQPAFLCDKADRNYGVDERAEVGLISRNITLTSTTAPASVTDLPPTPGSGVHWGGEIMIHHGFKKVVIQGVRLSKFGKDKLGSYPIHFHEVGDIAQDPNPGTANVLVNADSVDHSYNKCVTIHATSNLTISNLVCARIVGHIFYEELNSANQTNPASDSDIAFNHDLGIGAMSNSFDIYKTASMTRQEMINQYWWAGDYMTNAECKSNGYDNCINYDGFNIPDTDNQTQLTHGACFKPGTLPGQEGLWIQDGNPPCGSGRYYIEPASGFWIQNPGTVLTNDAIAGCQGDGVGYWWVPPVSAINVDGIGHPVNLTYASLGKVKDDRSSACYHAYFAEGENGVISGQLTPVKDEKNPPDQAFENKPNVISHFEGLTATHDRFRAFWIRGTAAWFVLKDGHFADNNRSATMLTSGGVDGNGPGIWDLIENSVFVGESRNSVGRWGPCPETQPWGQNTGWKFGCIDYSHPQNVSSNTPHSGELDGKGYPWPYRNSYGYQIYDGPPLIYHDRFVNFNYDKSGTEFSSLLDTADQAALKSWETSTGKPYEGDAAFGWFPSNQNAYPTASATKQLMWVNTNLRHQIFTEHVNIGSFEDGDKNTAFLDEDGTLSGFGVKLAPNSGTHPVYAASLNNLPFNSTSNSVDECLSRGAQDQKIQGRDSSLMSPAEMGTLEFSNLYPWKADPAGRYPTWPGWRNSHWQKMTFTRTDRINNGKGGTFRPSMSLLSRNGQGYWEPKVSNGYGYTVTVAPASATSRVPADQNTHKAGIYKWIDVGVADVMDPNITANHPFYIRLGIDYASVDKSTGKLIIPNGNFTIKRGYKTYYGGNINVGSTFNGGEPNALLSYFTKWGNCHGLDGSRVDQPTPNIPIKQGPGCPAGMNSGLPAVKTLTSAGSISALTDSKGNPVIDKYYYDTNTGYLWLNIVQEVANAEGPSPIGSCDKDFDAGTPDPACQYANGHGESYYVCPKNGCIIYAIRMDDPNYTEGTSPTTAQLPPEATHLMPAPAHPNELKVIYGANPGTVVKSVSSTDDQGTVYNTASAGTGPTCTVTQHDGG